MTETTNSELSHNGQRSFQNRTVRSSTFRIAFAAFAGFTVAGALAQANDVATTRSATEPSACPRAGAVWWNELLAPETERLTEFYAKVIGWNTKVVDVENQTQPARTPNDRYTVFMSGDQEIAGLMRANHPEAIHSGVGWFTYIQVADVEAAAKAARANGGTILREPMETSDGNEFAVVSDPMGNVFGLVTPAKKGPC